jgi:hypothetical protein
MYVIHAHWRPASTPTQSGALCIWCETSEAQAPNRKIDKRHRDLQPHPFVVEITRVRAVLVRLTGLDLTGGDDNLSLRLPTGRTAPQPSPQLVHEWPLDESTLSLAPWQIPALALNPADALTLLMKLPTEELPHDMRLADDLHFWRTAARLALEALAQHRLQPGLVSDAAGKLVASWLPVLDGPRDGPRLARLREAMPPLCRAAVVNTEPTPRSLLDSFLAALVDGAMRRWCRTMPLALRGRRRNRA